MKRLKYGIVGVTIVSILFVHAYTNADFFLRHSLYNEDYAIEKRLYLGNNIDCKTSHDYIELATLYNKNKNYTMSNKILDEMYLNLDLNILGDIYTLQIFDLMFDNNYELKEYYRCLVIGEEYMDYYVQSKNKKGQSFVQSVFEDNEEQFNASLGLLQKYLDCLLVVENFMEAKQFVSKIQDDLKTLSPKERIYDFYESMLPILTKISLNDTSVKYLEEQYALDSSFYIAKPLIFIYANLYDNEIIPENKEILRKKMKILIENHEKELSKAGSARFVKTRNIIKKISTDSK